MKTPTATKITLPPKPPICEDDGCEMDLGVDPRTGNFVWGCPECGWSFDMDSEQ
jgi:hypothetical protein